MGRALRPLAWFWGALLLLVMIGAVTLQMLGPPRARMAVANMPPPAAAPLPPLAAAEPPPPLAVAMAPRPPPLPAIPGVKPVAPPQADLQEGEAVDPATMLPRIGPDGRQPMQVYAAYADPADRRPRIAILVAGLGMSASESEDAIQNLPAAVSLAFSPYAYKPEPLLDEARAHGHEYLVSIPMEPQGYPLDDPGNRALMTGNTDAENLRLLDWSLSRFAGYVGATGALGSLRGERFGASTTQMAPILSELAMRGLLYVDPRPDAPRPADVVGRSVDLVLDTPAVRTEIEAKLAQLEQIAHDRGSAIGLAGQPLPVTVDRIAAWTNTLASRGFALVPVSALAPVVPPPLPSAALSLSGAGSP
jgi:polysaccharide deacetylase 2 family uncharacterized protein YibQ